MDQKNEDQSRETFHPEGDPAEGFDWVETSSGGLVSRHKALKLAGAVTLGGALGLLGSQEEANARKKKRRRPAPRLGANVPGPHVGRFGTIGDRRIAQVFINPFAGNLT